MEKRFIVVVSHIYFLYFLSLCINRDDPIFDQTNFHGMPSGHYLVSLFMVAELTMISIRYVEKSNFARFLNKRQDFLQPSVFVFGLMDRKKLADFEARISK